MSDEELSVTDATLTARLRNLYARLEGIEQLVKERDRYRDAFNTNCLVLRGTEERVERLEAALHNCVGMLDQLVAESGRDIEWGAEDPFRMGEWFEPEDLAQIEQARAALKGDDHI